MKYLMLTITVISLMSCSLLPGDKDIAESDVPSVVRNAFASKYPDVKEVDWEKAHDDFEADFELDNLDYSILINSKGKVIMQKQEITKAELPEAVTAGINKEFADLRLDEIEKIEKDGNIYFQIEFDGTVKDKEVVFTSNGQQEKTVAYWD